MSEALQFNEIALTGGTGGIGSYMPSECQSLSFRLESSVADLVKELKNLQVPPKVLIHLAGLVSVSECENNPQKAYEINVLGTRKVWEGAKETGVKTFIYASTSHVYGSAMWGEKIDIDHSLDPGNVYGKTKLQAEEELKRLREEAIERKEFVPNLKIARIFSVLSGRGKPWTLLAGLQKRMKEEDDSMIPGLENVRDFLTGEEVCQQLLQLAQSDLELVNVCSGKGQLIYEVAKKVYEQAGRSFPFHRPEILGTYIVGVPSLHQGSE